MNLCKLLNCKDPFNAGSEISNNLKIISADEFFQPDEIAF